MPPKVVSNPSVLTIGSVSVPVNTRKALELVPSEGGYVIGNGKKSGDIEMAERILLGIKHKMPVLLIGPTGCGKTATIKWLAAKTKNGYRRIQLNGSTNVENFVGRWLINSQGTYWVDGILTDAMRKGHWLILDELNAALSEILFVLHSIMDDDGVLILDEKDGEIVTPHPDFRIFATMNPSEDYAGTKEVNRALMDRFPITLEVEYPEKDKEAEIIVSRSGMAADYSIRPNTTNERSTPTRMVEFATAVRKLNSDDKIIFTCSTRQLINWAVLTPDLGVKNAALVVFSGKTEASERKLIMQELNKLFRDDENVPKAKLDKIEADRLASLEKAKTIQKKQEDDRLEKARATLLAGANTIPANMSTEGLTYDAVAELQKAAYVAKMRAENLGSVTQGPDLEAIETGDVPF